MESILKRIHLQWFANEVFNDAFSEIIPDGAPGNQAYKGIFYQDRRGMFKRLTQAEGHETAKNPETEEKNTIGMKQAKTVVKGYKETFSKDILIEKGDENYEFYNDFNEKEYVGKNAELKMLMVDFMQSIPAGNGRQKYKAYSYICTVSADTVNNTDGTLSVSFNQSSDRTAGVAEYDEKSKSAVFTPSSEIPVTGITVSDDDVKLDVGEEKWVSVDFEPFGAPDAIAVKVVKADPGDPDYCKAEVRRGSVVITGLEQTTTSVEVTVKDAATETVTATIDVTVN
jgi:hypothetical protein